MREKQTAPEKIIVIDIKLTRGLVVALSCILVLVMLLTYLSLARDSASASETEAAPAASAGMRQFYLSKLAHDGPSTLTACAAGYHMASLWEITDPSNLVYNTVEGRTKADGGQGPPTDEHGWVRTGYQSSGSSTPGRGNCLLWTVGGTSYSGTQVRLVSDWASDLEDMGVWSTRAELCQFGYPVWCVED